MDLSTIIATKTDFDDTSWEQIIADCEPKQCRSYYRRLLQQSRESADANDLTKAKVFLILGYIAALHLEVPPYEPPFSNIDYLQVLDDAEWNVLAEVAPEVNDAELRARIADLLWVEKRVFPMTQLAIESYLETAHILEDSVEWSPSFKRIERATELWSHLGGKNNNQLPDVVSYIEGRLDHFNGEDPGIFSAKLMEILIPLQASDPAKYIALAEKAATNNPANKCDCQRPARSRAYWRIKAMWHHIAQQLNEEREAQIRVAETYVEEAQGHLVCRPGSYSQANWFLQFGIEAFRKIGGMQQRTDEIYQLYREYQRLSWEGEHDTIQSQGFDLGQIVQTAETLVSGKTLRQAVLALATITGPQSVISLRNLIMQMAQNEPFQFHIPMFKYNEDARVVEVRDSLFMGSEEEKESALEAEMFRRATFFQDAFARGFIRPAVQRIMLEHPIHFREFTQIVQNNPFIPNGREYIFARGLYAGMVGDFLTATHLLIPQLEQAFRHLLDKNEVRTTGLDSDGVQDAHLLDTLLKHPKLAQILGEDIVFDMRGLLNERFGSNLRNEMAHGLIETFIFFSDRCVYLWWLTLHLCCVPLVDYPNPNLEDNEEAEGTL